MSIDSVKLNRNATKRKGSDSSSNSSEESKEEEIVDANLLIEQEVRGRMHRMMNKTQGQWFTNEFKRIEFEDQIADQRINRHHKNSQK